MGEPATVVVWPWSDAPEEYRAMSQHGGDEDWVVFIPKGIATPFHMDDSYLTHWGHVDWHTLDSGASVVIYAHA